MAKRSRPAAFIDDPLWYKDAVIYQLHVKAFADSNNDGIGDFAGLTEKLDYLRRKDAERYKALIQKLGLRR